MNVVKIVAIAPNANIGLMPILSRLTISLGSQGLWENEKEARNKRSYEKAASRGLNPFYHHLTIISSDKQQCGPYYQ